MHICILLYIHVTCILYYILASFQKIENVNVNVLLLLSVPYFAQILYRAWLHIKTLLTFAH